MTYREEYERLGLTDEEIDTCYRMGVRPESVQRMMNEDREDREDREQSKDRLKITKALLMERVIRT